jgi:hypothetical protein
MTAEERIAQLESENAALRGENAALREERAILAQQLEHLLARLEEVEGRLAKDSHKSSKPPSSDGPARKRGSQRAKSGKQMGGQEGACRTHDAAGGQARRDRWKSYDHYPCAHSICGAHLLRDGTSIQEQEQQEWAEQMHDLRLSLAAAAEEWRQRGAQAVPGSDDTYGCRRPSKMAVSWKIHRLRPSALSLPNAGAGVVVYGVRRPAVPRHERCLRYRRPGAG